MDPRNNDSCTCDCKCAASRPGMAITQLEMVQILVIVVVMMMMVVVITCLLNQYKLSAQSLIPQHGQTHRHPPLLSDGSLLPSDGPGSASGINEMFSPGLPDRVPPASLTQERFGRFQPTYPYLSHTIINLPPNIPLSDGEEPPPYQGPCTLKLRDPEQQLELNRESVRAPPNRTIFDSHLTEASLCPPSIHAGNSTASLECPPPAYSEVIGHYFHLSSVSHHTQTPPEPGLGPALLIRGDPPRVFPRINSSERENSYKPNHSRSDL